MQPIIAPIETKQLLAPLEENAVPVEYNTQTPMPSGVFEDVDTANRAKFSGSYEAWIKAKVAKTSLAGEMQVESLGNESTTNDSLSRNYYEQVKAFNTGSATPYGGGGFSMQPNRLGWVNNQRDNDGTPIILAMSAPYLRGIGNAFGDRVNASNYGDMSSVITTQANTDPAGFAQTKDNGLIVQAEPTMRLERGWNAGGALFGMNRGDVNAGSQFSKTDGGGGGVASAQELAVLSATPQAVMRRLAPSGLGALMSIKAYGVATTL